MNAYFLKAGRSFPLIFSKPNMTGEPILGYVEGRWFRLPFSVASFEVPLSHDMHVRTEHTTDVVRAGTVCADTSASLMFDRADEWKWIKAMPLMGFAEFRMRVECAGQQRSATCEAVANALSMGSIRDKRLALSTVHVNQEIDPVPVVIAVLVFLVVGAFAFTWWRTWKKRNGGGGNVGSSARPAEEV